MFRVLFTTMLALCITASPVWAASNCGCDLRPGGKQYALLESAKAASGGNRAEIGTWLRFAELESGFGCAQGRSFAVPNPSNYNYNVTAQSSSATGPNQFIEGTWNDTVARHRNYIQSEAAKAANSTSDPVLKQQYQEFAAYAAGRSKSPYSWKYYASLIGPSSIMAKAYAMTNKSTVNPTTSLIAAKVPGIDAYSVSAYISHNVGQGESALVLKALQQGRTDLPVDQIFKSRNKNGDLVSIVQNPGIWCAKGTSAKTCVPLPLSEALKNINNRSIGGACVKKALATVGLSPSAVNVNLPQGSTGLNDYTPPVDFVPDPGLKILAGKIAGESNKNACHPFAAVNPWCPEDDKTAQNSAGKGGGSGAQNDDGGDNAGDAAADDQPLTNKEVMENVRKAGGPAAVDALRKCRNDRMCIVRKLNEIGVSPAPSRAGSGTAQESANSNQSQPTLNRLSQAGGTKALDRFKACNKNSVCEGTVLSDYKVPVPATVANPVAAKPKTSQASQPNTKAKSVTSDGGAQAAVARADESQAQKLAALERATINVRKANAAVTPQMAARTESARNFLKNPNLSAEARATFENQVAVYNKAVADQKSAQAAYQKAYAAVKGQ